MGQEGRVDAGQRGGITTEQAEKMKALERANRELKQANEILRKASAYFARATFYNNLAKQADPSRLSDHAKRDKQLNPEVGRDPAA
ncbi:hypothetical protein [Roseobacter litoralis]|uniref:hypothetical protein n=1 Tax=Roseobacter litoralis TaxID=42443 RepID=UPI003CD0E091